MLLILPFLIIALIIAFTGSKKLKIQDIELNIHKRKRFERVRWIFNEQIPSGQVPVMFLRGAVLKDGRTGKNLLQLKFVNTGDKEIKSVYATVSLIDDAGDVVENGAPIQAEYLDINCKGHDAFGQKRLLELGGMGATHIRVAINKAVFADGTVWRTEQEAEPLKFAKVTFLKNVLPPELQSVVSEDTICKPETLSDGLWRCTCGCLVVGDSCLNCQRTFAQAQEETSIDQLEQRRQKKFEEQEQQELDKAIAEKEFNNYTKQLIFGFLALSGSYLFVVPLLISEESNGFLNFLGLSLMCVNVTSLIATALLMRKIKREGTKKDAEPVRKIAKIQGQTALASCLIIFLIACLIYFCIIISTAKEIPYSTSYLIFEILGSIGSCSLLLGLGFVANYVYCRQLPFAKNWLTKHKRKKKK